MYDNLIFSLSSQVEPFMRATVFPMPDAPVMQRDQPVLAKEIESLKDITRDIQNLASKFKCNETAAIQQAMRWVHSSGLLPSVLRLPVILHNVDEHSVGNEEYPSSLDPSMPAVSLREEEEEEDMVELASRLSFAALQWLPQCTHDDKMAILRGRVLAMETFSVVDRVRIACEVMSVQRDQLAAKCALATIQG